MLKIENNLHFISIIFAFQGIALKYEEMFESAVNSFSKSQKLDPTWDGPKKQEENLLHYLDKISTLIELKVFLLIFMSGPHAHKREWIWGCSSKSVDCALKRNYYVIFLLLYCCNWVAVLCRKTRVKVN